MTPVTTEHRFNIRDAIARGLDQNRIPRPYNKAHPTSAELVLEELERAGYEVVPKKSCCGKCKR